MNTNVIMTLFQNMGNILNLTAGYFFMKSIDCCLKRRKSRVLFLIGLFGYGTVASIIVYPQDMWNIFFLQKPPYHRKVVVHVMTEFTDLALILFQLVIIIFLELQIFPFHIGKNPV